MPSPNTHESGVASLLRELRDRDTDTGLLTPWRVFQCLLGEVARSERYGNKLSCLLLELRGFSAADDETRLKLTTRLADVMRNTDYAGDWGEGEFLLVLPETDDDGARAFDNKLKSALAELDLPAGTGGEPSVTITTSITTRLGGDDARAILTRLGTEIRG